MFFFTRIFINPQYVQKIYKKLINRKQDKLNMENKSENENKNKTKMRIYEDQTQLQQFIEPEWMKILKDFMKKNRIIEIKQR